MGSARRSLVRWSGDSDRARRETDFIPARAPFNQDHFTSGTRTSAGILHVRRIPSWLITRSSLIADASVAALSWQ
jgi:hypothetical protein